MNYYVYTHSNRDGEIVYVGMGQGHRCLDRYRRSPEHSDFISKSLNEVGVSFMELVSFGLSKRKATVMEKRLIETHTPLFNKQMNGACNAGRGASNPMAAFSSEQVAEIRLEFSKWEGSMREFRRRCCPEISWSTLHKLLTKKSYKESF